MKFDDIKKLHQKKYREQFGYFLAEGEHPVLELQKAAQHNPLLQRSELYVTAAYQHWQSAFKIHVIHERQMAQLADTKTPQGIIALVPVFNSPATATTAANERVIYLHEIQDPGNLGTILRTLAWFGNSRCLLSPGSVDPFNAKVVRSSMGAIFHVPIELDVELDSLSARFARIGYLDMQGDSVLSDNFKSCDCYLFGNEARGVPRAPLNALNALPFTIPGGKTCSDDGAIESLNLASAVNICVYELNR
jgi:TrmH family RNA methyltransferase